MPDPNTPIKVVGFNLDADDLWRNVFWLRTRIETLEAKVRALESRGS